MDAGLMVNEAIARNRVIFKHDVEVVLEKIKPLRREIINDDITIYPEVDGWSAIIRLGADNFVFHYVNENEWYIESFAFYSRRIKDRYGKGAK